MNSKSSVDRHARRIAGASSLVAASFAVFWIIQVIRGAAPRDDLFLVVNIFFLTAVAYMFGRIVKEGGKIGVMPMLLFLSSALRFVRNPLAKQDLGVAGMVTFVAAVGLLVADIALRSLRRRAAEHAVAADGASPRR